MPKYIVELSLALEFEEDKTKDAKQFAKYIMENILYRYGYEGGTGKIIRLAKKKGED